MKHAIRLARPGTTFPNPAVGCVIYKNDSLVGQGFTGSGGRPHAEDAALGLAGLRAEGATLFVTLEPCNSRSRGGLSCTDRIIEAGIAEVFVACLDPSPHADGQGLQRMRESGIGVTCGVGAKEADFLIKPSRYYYTTGLAMVSANKDGIGFDGPYEARCGDDHKKKLRELADKGYRSLFVTPYSQLFFTLNELGLIV